MKDKILCVMAGYDSITDQQLSNIQNKLYEKGYVGNQTKSLPQHITLGVFPVDKEQELIDLVHNVARDTKPFKITLNHIGIFGGGEVLFLSPDVNYELLTLKEHFGESQGWTPHSTMLIDSVDKIAGAISIVLECFSPFRGQIQNIHLYEFWPTRHILTVSLAE